jgi:hypothetical protein
MPSCPPEKCCVGCGDRLCPDLDDVAVELTRGFGNAMYSGRGRVCYDRYDQLRRDTDKKILEYLRGHDGATPKEICEALGRQDGDSTVERRLLRLQTRRMVRIEKKGKNTSPRRVYLVGDGQPCPSH